MVIEVLLPDPPTNFTQPVRHWGTALETSRAYSGVKQWNGSEIRYAENKSSVLGAYPKNTIGEKDYDN